MYVKALLPTSETLNRESSLFKNMEAPIMPLAKASSFDYPCMWEWLGPGGLPGLQNLWRVALRAAVGSTPIHSRLLSGMKDPKGFRRQYICLRIASLEEIHQSFRVYD